jgi:hypothetical protein
LLSGLLVIVLLIARIVALALLVVRMLLRLSRAGRCKDVAYRTTNRHVIIKRPNDIPPSHIAPRRAYEGRVSRTRRAACCSQRPETWKFVALRRFEDAIDALVCAWMAAEFWSGRARAVGDANAPIWIPHLRDSDR